LVKATLSGFQSKPQYCVHDVFYGHYKRL
jgi:hypothetical protein